MTGNLITYDETTVEKNIKIFNNDRCYLTARLINLDPIYNIHDEPRIYIEDKSGNEIGFNNIEELETAVSIIVREYNKLFND